MGISEQRPKDYLECRQRKAWWERCPPKAPCQRSVRFVRRLHYSCCIEEGKKVGNVIRLVSGANFDAGDLHRHVKEIDNCHWVLHDSRDEELAGKVITT